MRNTFVPLATRRAAVLATAAAILAPSGCGRAAEPVRFGQIAPLSGGGAVSGPSHVNGARLALALVNAAGDVLGQPAELVVEDGLSTPDGARRVTRLQCGAKLRRPDRLRPPLRVPRLSEIISKPARAAEGVWSWLEASGRSSSGGSIRVTGHARCS